MASLAKPGEQITGIVDGQIVPAMETPLLTSASTSWFGFLLEKHNAGGRGDICWGWHRPHVSLITKGQLSFRVRSSGGPQDYVGRAGSVCVFPSGFDETHFSISQSKFEAIVLGTRRRLAQAFSSRRSPYTIGTLPFCSEQWRRKWFRAVLAGPSTAMRCLLHWPPISTEGIR